MRTPWRGQRRKRATVALARCTYGRRDMSLRLGPRLNLTGRWHGSGASVDGCRLACLRRLDQQVCIPCVSSILSEASCEVASANAFATCFIAMRTALRPSCGYARALRIDISTLTIVGLVDLAAHAHEWQRMRMSQCCLRA